MEKMGSFFYGLMAFVAGGALMVAGWWISMLNISIDRFSTPTFTNFWTLFGLALIFLGAYMPFIFIGMRTRALRKQHRMDRAHKQLAEEHAAVQAQVAAADHGEASAESPVAPSPERAALPGARDPEESEFPAALPTSEPDTRR